MLKPHSSPFGYKKLLAYRKAEKLQAECRSYTSTFPKTKTTIDLADQMDRSARSGKQNIVEGWKRNSSKEYYDFLGFSIGATAELQEDCKDIHHGVYPEIKKGGKGARGLKGIKKGTSQSTTNHPGVCDLENLRFYPLDDSLPTVVQLYLRCKELIYLLTKIQTSLESKMINENTLSSKDKSQIIRSQKKKEGFSYEKFLDQQGLIRLSDGRVVKKDSLKE